MKKIGVFVGRFQVDELSTGHKYLIDTILSENDDIIIGLGVSVTKIERTNPLSYDIRKFMIQEQYPNAIIIPIKDVGHVGYWNKILDATLEPYSKDATITIYGSRDSMLNGYDGKYNKKEIISIVSASGTEIRTNIAKNIENSRDFRKGIIYAAYERYPVGYSVVDMICVDETKILLGKKPNRDQYCIIGGFYDNQKDTSLEDAALREFKEETGLDAINPKYFMSAQINDYRFRNESNKIISSVFILEYNGGTSIADDDIEEVKWFDIREIIKKDELSNFYNMIIPQHRDIMIRFVEYFTKDLYDLYETPNPNSIKFDNYDDQKMIHDNAILKDVDNLIKYINLRLKDNDYSASMNKIAIQNIPVSYSKEVMDIVKFRFMDHGWSNFDYIMNHEYMDNIIILTK
jgi:bifunctional NMN adenylyltransferase/nudix hydrolase